MRVEKPVKPLRRRRGLPAFYKERQEQQKIQAQRERQRHRAALDRLGEFGSDTVAIIEAPDTGGSARLTFDDIRVFLPNGNQRMEIGVDSQTHCLEALADALSKQLVVLGTYSAIACLDTGEIEALITRIRAPGPSTQHPFFEAAGMRPMNLWVSDGTWRVELSAASDLFTALDARMLNRMAYAYPAMDIDVITLKISGRALADSDHAEQLLAEVAQGWSFDLDAVGCQGFQLAKRPAWPYQLPDGSRRNSQHNISSPPPPMPSRSYEKEALAFYWYARSMQGAPFVQFLAYYQVIEFHFTRCAHSQQMADLAAELNSRDASMSEQAFLSSILDLLNAKPAPKDGTQLRLTIEQITTPAELKAFILNDKDLRRYLEKASVRPVRVTRATDATLLAPLIGEHIYSTRNRVVHGKQGGSDGTQLLLLPDDPQFTLLSNALPLMRYLAIQAVIYSSSHWEPPAKPYAD